MRISFDLDGVITNSEKWFYGMLSALRAVHPNQNILDAIEILYYSTRQVLHNPYLLLSVEDKGYIITARKPKSKPVTEEWLASNNISLEVIYVDASDNIDWSDYQVGSIASAARKARVIKSLGINVHFDNNPYIVDVLRDQDIIAVLVGGEPCLSSM